MRKSASLFQGALTSADPLGFVLMDLGTSDYDVVYETQLGLVEQKKLRQVQYDYLILVEHPDVYTYGRKSRAETPDDFSNSYFVERGGEVTFHNVGQLVAYPILSL